MSIGIGVRTALLRIRAIVTTFFLPIIRAIVTTFFLQINQGLFCGSYALFPEKIKD